MITNYKPNGISEQEILTCLLRFFSLPPPDQVKQLEEYHNNCKAHGDAHLYDLLVELSEGLWSYANRFLINGPEYDELVAMFIGDQETIVLFQELACLIKLMWKNKSNELFSPDQFESVEWRILRRYSGDALARCEKLVPSAQMSLYDLMWNVVD